MTYCIGNWYNVDLGAIPGVYESYGVKYIDLYDEEFGPKITELMKDYDVMLCDREKSRPIIWLDNKGGRFRQR